MTDDTSDSVFPTASGTRVHTLQPTGPTGRDMDGRVRQVLGESYSGDRDLYEALGYVKDPTFAHFEARYLRGGAAKALVDKPAKDAWGERPDIADHASESDDETTAFETQARDFLDGEYTREKPLAAFETVHRMARLGEYALLFLGFDDAAVADATDPTDALADPVDEASLDSLDDINYLAVYDQDDAPDDGIDWVEDPTDPRFNQPESYNVDFGRGRGSARIHHTRVIHVAEDALDGLFSPSVLLRSLNRLDDLEKILGSSAEGFWRNAYQGLVVSPPESAARGQSLSEAGKALHDQIKRYRHNVSREIFTSGDVETLSVNVPDPEAHLKGQYAEIAAGHDIPQSMLRGNETGERATGEDKAMYYDYIARIQRQFCEVHVLRAVLDYLRDLGLLPDPDGEGYDVEWPPLAELSEKEEAEIRNMNAQAVERLSGGMPSEFGTLAERRALVGWDPEFGAEVEDAPATQPTPEGDDGEADEADAETAPTGDDAVTNALDGLERVTVPDDDPPENWLADATGD